MRPRSRTLLFLLFLVGVVAELLPSCPSRTYTRDRWMVAELGATCDSTCGSVGLSCDSAKQTALTNLAEDALVMAFAEAGFTCDKKGSDLDYGEGRDYAGAPFTVSVSGENVCVGFKASSSAVSSCSGNAYSNHRPLCRCVVNVGEETCYDPKNEVIDLAQTCGEDRNQPCQATALPDYHGTYPPWNALDGTTSFYHANLFTNMDLDCGTWTVIAQGWIPSYDAPAEWGGQFINSGDLPPYTHVRYECQYTNGAGTTTFNRTTDTTGCSGGAPYTECHDSATQFLISASGTPRFIIRDGEIHCIQDYNEVGGNTDNPNLGQWGRTSIATCTTKPNTIGRTVLAYNGVPPASAWSASSLHPDCDDANYFGVGAILETSTDRCACLGGASAYSWLQLDLGSPMSVTGIATQGRPWTGQWVTLYEIQVSDDNSVFTRVHCATESGGYCPGNTGWPSTKKFELVSNDLIQPVTARYVRLIVRGTNSYNSIRMGVYVREGWQALRINLENPAYISHLRITPRQDCCQARMDMVQIRVGNDEHEISNNPRCNVGSTKILFFEDTSPYSWTEAWRLALARGGRLPTLTECRDYIAKNGGFFTENLWMPVTSPISPDESITRVQIEGTPNSGAEYCRIGHSDSSVWGQGHFADLNTGYDPINLLDAWGTGAHQKMLGVVRDEGIPWKDGDLTVKDIGCFATGKYVWIYTYTSFSQMNFAKVEIMGIEQPWKNLARSCTYGACPSDSNIGFPTGGTDLQKTQNPSRAVDGLFLRHSAFYAGGSVDDPWWRVELQSRADVKMVRITGQMDFASGNNDVDIRVGDSPIPFKNPVCASGVTRSTLTQFTVHTDAGTHSWSEAKAFAESQGGRLPTLNELRHYEATTSYFATANWNHWIPVLNHNTPSGADYFMGYNGHGYSIGDSRWERDPSDGDPISSTFGTQDWTGVGEYGVWVSTDSAVVPCVGEGNFVFVTKAGTATSFSLMQVEVLGTYQESCPVNHYGQTPVPYAAVVSVDDVTFIRNQDWETLEAEKCASEHGTCTCSGWVKYCGQNNGVCYGPQHSSGSIACTNGQFGDPNPGYTKHCYCRASHIDLGTRTWNIQSNGGFTAVARFMFTGTPNDCTWCRIFDFSSGAENDNIVLTRAADNQRFRFDVREGSTMACMIEDTAHEIHFDHWQTAVARYRAVDNTLELTISSDNHIDRIFHGSEDPITFRTTCTSITDRVSTQNYIGKSAWDNDYFHGKIAGVHAFDYYLTDAECETVLHSIVYGASRHTGAWMEYAGVGRDGAFGNIGPVVSLDDTWFNEVNSYYLDMGEKRWNVETGGGFTLITKVRSKGGVGNQPRIFAAINGFDAADNSIQLVWYTDTMFYVYVNDGGTSCEKSTISVEGTYDDWQYIIWRYKASTKYMSFLVNGIEKGFQCGSNFKWNDATRTYNFLGRSPWSSSDYFNGDIGGLYAFDRFMSLTEAQEVLDGIEVNTTFLDARDCTVYDFTGTNSLSSFQAYATSVGISTSLNSWHADYGVNGGVFVSGYAVGWIQIPLIAGYDTVSIEYGHAYVDATVTLCVCSTTGVLCDNSQCETKQTPSPNTMSTFSTKYVPGGSIVIQEGHSVIDDNLIIKFTNGPNCQRLFPGNDFLGTQFLETKAINMSDGLVSRFKLEGDLTDTECADPCIDWSVEWIEDTIAPWGHDAVLEWATGYTLSPWTGTGATPQSRLLFAHELIHYLSSHENINFPVGGDEWATVRNNADDAYTWVQVASGAWAAYKYLHTTEYQDSAGYSHTSASWDGYMFRMVPSIREITTNELELARMCGANSDQPCTVTGSSWLYGDYSTILDSDEDTKWHSTTTGVTEWLRIDLGQASRVNRIVVHPPNHGGGNYYAGRVDGIQIHVGDIESVTDNSICGMIQVPLDGTENTNPGPFALNCNLKGQYVYMRWLENDGDWKQAGSVYVYGHRLPTFHYDNLRGQVLDNSAQQHYIRSAELSSLLDQDSWTVAVWVKTDDLSIHNHIFNLYDYTTANGERGGSGMYIGPDGKIEISRQRSGGNSWVQLKSNTVVEEHQWYHVTGVSSPRELKIYINGVFDSSIAASSDWAYTQEKTTNNIGLGLYCTLRGLKPVFHYDDISFTGTQALNAGQSTWNFAHGQGFSVVVKMKYTAAAYYEGFFSFQSTSNSHKIELVRFDTSSALYLHWYDANGVGCNSPYAAGPGGTTHGVPTPSDTWFTLKIIYDHSSKQLCQWVNGDEKCHTCPSNFALADTVMDSWLGATSQTNSFSGAIAGVYAFDHTFYAHDLVYGLAENDIIINGPDLTMDLGCYEHPSVQNHGHRQDLRFYNTALSAEAIERVASYPGNDATIVTHTTLPSRDIRNLVVSVDDTRFSRSKFFSVGSGTFSQVQASCQSAGGNLAAIHNANEQSEVHTLCSSVMGTHYGCYIGLIADSTGQPWYWVDGSAITYTNWYHGDVNYVNGGELVVIARSKDLSGQWDDWGTGSDGFPGICRPNEYDLPPLPISFLDLGPKQFNLVSDGGFTAVMKVKWTVTAGSYEKVFDFAAGIGNENLDGEILLARHATDRRVYFRIFEGSTNMGTASSDYIIMQDQWYSIMCRYTAYSNLMELKIDDYHYTTTPSNGIKDRMASSSWIGKSHWGDAYFNGEIAGLYAFSASLTDREVDRILAGIHINATDDFETSHHNDKVLHDTHQTCSACPGEMYAPAGSTGISQCQHVCPAGTYAESVRLYPSDRNVDASRPPGQGEGSLTTDILGDFDLASSVWDDVGLDCVQIDLGSVYPVSKVHIWQVQESWFSNGRYYHNQQILLSETGLWTSTEQTGDEVIAWSCTTNCPPDPSSGAGRIIEFEPTNARFVRHCSEQNNENSYNHWVEVHVYGTLCTSCPAGSHSPRGSTSHSDCVCESQHPRDYGNYTDKYMEDRTGVKGWTLAKHLTKDGTKWFSRDHMQGGRWVKGSTGSNCDDTCGNLNLQCDSPAQSVLTTNELVADAFLQAGYVCNGFHSAQGYAGAPFSTGRDPDDCAPFVSGGTGSTHTEYIQSFCAGNSHSNHAPLCHCVGDSDYEQTTHTYHPDWTEILFVRAPKTANEKWVRMSRSQWDAIAGEDYDGGIVDAAVLGAYPLKTTTTKAKRRNDGDTSPWVFAPPSTGTSPVDEFTAVYASYDSASHTTNTAWDHQKPVGTEFQVFVRAPTWQDHYVGCLDTSGGYPPGVSLGQVSSVNTFADALALCSNYDYFFVQCGGRVDCLYTFDDHKFISDNACRGQPELAPGINSGGDSSCTTNIGSDGSSKGGYSKAAVYSTKSRTHTCQAKDLNCEMGEAVHTELKISQSVNYRLIFEGECSGGAEIRMWEGNGDNPGTQEERVAKCEEACRTRKAALSGTWDGFDLQGFIVTYTTGRCYCESDISTTCTHANINLYYRYDWDDTFDKLTQQAYLNGGRLPTPYELKTWLLNEASLTSSDSIAAVYNPKRKNGEDWMWLNGRFATQLYSDHQVVSPTTPQSPYPHTHWIGTEIPVVLSGVSLTTWHCWTGSTFIKPQWSQSCVSLCPYPSAEEVLTERANWCMTPQNLLANTEARMANCGGGSYDWGANHYCPVWNPDGSPTNPGADAVHVILDAGSPVEVKAFKWAASGNANRMHGSMRVYRSDDAVTWTTITTFDVSASYGGSLDDTNPDATVEDMVNVYGNYDFGTARYWKFSPYGATYQVNGLLLRICSTATCKPARQLVTAFDTPTCSHCSANVKGDAVVSMDDRSFNRANSDYVNVGMRTYNIATNGGFTLVSKVRFTATPVNGYERIFQTSNALQAVNDDIQILRYGTGNMIEIWVGEGSTYCNKADIPFEQNTWYTIVFRYVTESKLMSLELNGIRYEKVCDSNFIVTDRTNRNSFIGKASWSSNDLFNGDMAGLYVWDRYLNDIEVASVTQGIHINEKDDLHPDTCMENCPSGTYRNTAFHGAVISQDDASFVRSAEYSVRLTFNPLTWHLQTQGVTVIMKVKPTGSKADWERIFAFNNNPVNVDGDFWVSRFASNDKWWFNMHNKCAAQSDDSASLFGQNIWMTFICRYNQNTQIIEMSINGNVFTSSCSGVVNVVTADHIIGYDYDSGNHRYFEGSVAGFYAWDRYLSDAEVTKVVDSIHIAATDDSLESTCACAADTYARKEETIHFHSINSAEGYAEPRIWTRDGCIASDIDYDPQISLQTETHAVRCCAQDGSSCTAYSSGSTCFPVSATYPEAIQACTAAGMRLCTMEEIDSVCCGTGCSYDGQRIWSSSEAQCDSSYTLKWTHGCEGGPGPVPRFQTDRISVRCCSQDGSSCTAYSSGSTCFPGSATYTEAVQACTAAGMRLCTREEYDSVCCGTGCSYDHNSVWTSNDAIYDSTSCCSTCLTVSWDDAVDYATGKGGRLPTKDEMIAYVKSPSILDHALINFRPVTGKEYFDGTRYENLGDIDWNVNSNGGFTVITSFKSMSTTSNLQIVNIGAGASPWEQIKIEQYTSDSFYITYYDGNDGDCGWYGNTDLPLTNNEVHTVIFRYDKNNQNIEVKIDDSVHLSKACSKGWDQNYKNVIGANRNSLNDIWIGHIYYVYGFDRYLNDIEVNAILNMKYGWVAVYDESSTPHDSWMDVSSQALDSSRNSGNLLAWVNTEENCHACQHGAGAPVGSVEGDCACKSPSYQSKSTVDPDVEAIVGSTGWNLIKELPAYGTTWYTNDELNIRKQTVGAGKIYDFTDMNDVPSWKAYASKIGATTSIQSHGANEGVWAGSMWIGWLELPLPDNFDTIEIDWGHGWNEGLVKLCICNTLGQVNSGLANEGYGYLTTYTSRCDNNNAMDECSVVQQPAPNEDLKYGPIRYQKGQVVRIEEVFATLNANIVIKLTNSQGYDDIPTPHFISNVVVDGCRRPNTGTQCRQAVPSGYTFGGSGSYSTDGCYCYDSSHSNYANTCWYGSSWAYRNTLPALTLPKFRPCLPETSFECIPYSLQACENAIPEGFTLSSISSSNQDGCYCYTRDSAAGNNANWCYYGTGGQDWVDPGVVSETATQFRPYGYDCGNQPESFTYVPDDEEWDEILFTREPHIDTYECEVSTTVSSSRPGFEGQPCVFPTIDGSNTYNSCADTISGSYPYGWCSLDPSGTYTGGDGGSKWGHCKPEKDICYTCTVTKDGNQRYHVEGSPCKFPWTVNSAASQNPYICRDIGSGTYPDGWCTPDDSGEYNGASVSSWGHCTVGKCLARTTNIGMDWIHMTKASFDANLAHNYSPQWLGVPVLDWSGTGATDMKGLSNYIEYTGGGGGHALSSPWLTLAPNTGVSVIMDHMIYHEEGNYYDPVGHDWSLGDKPMGTRFRTFVRNSRTSLTGSMYTLDGGGWRLVRRVKQGTSWHPATDSLAGTERYGTYTSDYTADQTFSVPFGEFDEFLFASGDGQLWLITDKNAVGGVLTGDYYSSTARNIKKSSTSDTQYTANWYHRSDRADDPFITLTDHIGFSIEYDTMVYAESGLTGHYLPTISTKNGANVFVRSAPPVITLNPVNNYRTFASTSDVLDMGSENRFNIKTNGGLTIVMKFRIHSGIATSGQWPSIFSFKEGAGTETQNNFYLNIATTMYFTLVKEDISDVYGTTACGMSSLPRPPENEFVDMVLVYDKNAQLFSISFSHINSGSAQTSACPVDLGDRMGRFHFNPSVIEYVVEENHDTDNPWGFNAWLSWATAPTLQLPNGDVYNSRPLTKEELKAHVGTPLNPGVGFPKSGAEYAFHTVDPLPDGTTQYAKIYVGSGTSYSQTLGDSGADTQNQVWLANEVDSAYVNDPSRTYLGWMYRMKPIVSTSGTGFLGDIAGFFAYDRVLSNEAINVLKSSIHTDKQNDPIPQSIVTDDPFVCLNTGVVALETETDTTIVSCPAGQEPMSSTCHQCPIGKYKDNVGSSACLNCPANKNTASSGAGNSNLCQCISGYYNTNPDDACLACDAGKYRAGLGSAVACDDCPTSSTTLAVAQDEAMDCQCNVGFTGPDGGTCEQCALHTFKPNIGSEACTSCPEGGETVATGQTSISACACTKPNYIDGAGETCVCDVGYGGVNECSLCPAGKTKATADLEECTNCGSFETSTGGSSLCVCTAGYYRLSGVCEPCAANTFKTDPGDEACTSCGDGTNAYTTSTASTSMTDCEANAGFYTTADGSVFQCPTDSTSAAGSTSNMDCKCNAGYGYDNAQGCLECAAGKYKTSVDNSACSECDSAGNGWGPAGLADPSQCVCLAGYTDSGVTVNSAPQCVACEAGKFKGPCMDHSIEVNLARYCGETKDQACPVSASSYHSFAPPSLAINGVYEQLSGCAGCHDPGGWRSSAGVDTQVDIYLKIDFGQVYTVDYIKVYPWYQWHARLGDTEYRVGNSENHRTNSICAEITENSPNSSPKTLTCGATGRYLFMTKPNTIWTWNEIWVAEIEAYGTVTIGCESTSSASLQPCTDCPEHSSSTTTANDEVGDCKCNAGSAGSGGTCSLCQAGTYSTGIDNPTCTSCPDYSSTTSPGSVSADECLCNAGAFGSTGSCGLCQAGTYSVGGANPTCTSCPSFSTSPDASTDPSACKCNAGYTISNELCVACSLNQYKDSVSNDACSTCPENSQSVEGSDEIADCQCNKGYFGPDGGPCTACHYGRYKDYVGPDTRLGYSACEACASDRTINFATAATSYRQCSCSPGTFMLTPENAHLAYYYDASDAGTGTCEPCPTNSSVIEQWRGNYISEDVQEIFLSSESGTWPTACQQCGPNAITDEIAGQCLCAAGFVTDVNGNCKAIKKGFFTQTRGEPVTVKIKARVHMTVEEFDVPAQTDYRQGIADAAGVHIDRVTIISINGVPVSRRRLLSGILDIETEIEVPVTMETSTGNLTEDVIESAEYIEAQLSEENIQENLQNTTTFAETVIEVTEEPIISGSCPPNSDAPEGATAITQCSCNMGYLGVILDESSTCTACPSGKYFDEVDIECDSCPDFTVSAEASLSLTDCKCNVGYSGNDGSTCIACPENTFKPVTGNASCTPCTDFSTTLGLNTRTNISECICDDGYLLQGGGDNSCDRICPPGHEASADEHACIACASGKYKSAYDDGTCQSCPSFTVMPADVLGSTSIDACPCQEGYSKHPDGDGSCVLCPPGKFTAQAGETECHQCYSLLTGR